MLDRFPVTAVLPARDVERARAFYRDVLGLELVSDPDDDPVVFRAGDGTSVLLTEMDREPAPHPVLSFAVQGIDELVPALKVKGATFVPLSASGTYAQGPGKRTPDVAELGLVRAAFLRDSEGNVITLNQMA